MLDRFIKLIDPVQKSLIEMKSDISFSSLEIDLIHMIVNTLAPVYSSVKFLCAANANLDIADTIFAEMFQELETIGTDLSRDLLDELRVRVKERRTVTSDVIQFLQNPNVHHKISQYITVHSKAMIEEKLREYARKIEKIPELTDEVDEIIQEGPQHDIHTLSFEERLRKSIAESSKIRSNNTPSASEERCSSNFQTRHAVFRYMPTDLLVTGVQLCCEL